jgi:DNA-directed RNA polymerase omega subunit
LFALLSFDVCSGVKRMSESPREIGPAESSRFREVVVAGLRAKQLLRGSKPRIPPHPDKRKNTTVAVEEVRRGLIRFTHRVLSQAHRSIIVKDADELIRITASEHDAFSNFNAGEGP